MAQIGVQPEHRLAIRPVPRAKRVAGRDIERLPVAGDPARRPDAAAAPTGPPGRDTLRIGQWHTDDPAVVIAAIAEKPAIGYVQRAVEEQQRAALVLHPRIEGLALCPQRVSDIDRPAGEGSAVLQRQTKDTVPRSGRVADHRIEVETAAGLVDDRGAGDAERVDIAAGECR